MSTTEDEILLTIERADDDERLEISMQSSAVLYELKLRIYERWHVITDHQYFYNGGQRRFPFVYSLL